MSNSIATVLIDALLNTAGINEQLKSLTFEPVRVVANVTGLQEMNRQLDRAVTVDRAGHSILQEQLAAQKLLAAEARREAVEWALTRSRQKADLIDEAQAIRLKAYQEKAFLNQQIQSQKLIAAQSKLEYDNQKRSIANDKKHHQRIVTTSEVTIKVEQQKRKEEEKVKTNTPGVISGAMQEVGRNAVKNFAETVQRNFAGSEGVLAKLGDKLAAPVKIFITDNPELKVALGRTSSLVEDRLRKTGYALGDAIIAGLDNQNTTIKDKLYRVGGTVVPYIKPAINQIKVDAKNIGRDVSGAIGSGTASIDYAQKADALIRDYRQGAINDRAIPELLKRASEIASEPKSSSDKKLKELIVASSTTGDKERDALIERIKKDANKNARIDYVQKRDTTASANVRGYSTDSIEMAAKGLAALEKNPTIKIKFVGEGSAGEASEGAAKMLQMLGVRNVSYLGVGTADFIGTPKDAPGRKIISPDEAYGARTAKTYGRAGLTRKPENEILGVKGSYYQSYSDQDLAEIQNFYKGAPKELTAKEIAKLQKTADNFAKIDTQNMDAGALEKVSIAAQKNLQKVRRHIIDAIGEPNQQLVSIAKTLESVNVSTTPESAKFAQARSAIKSSREILSELAKTPGIEAAQIAQVLNTQLKEVKTSFSDQNRQQLGTAGKKYKSLDAQLNEVIDQSGNRDNYAIAQKARESIPESKVSRAIRENTPVVKEHIKEISTKGLTVAATGTINIIGKAANAVYGAEKALLGEGGTKAVNALVAAVGVASLPGGHEAMGAIGHGVTQLAHMPLDALATNASHSAGSIVDNALSGSPMLKGLAPQITAAINHGLTGSAGAVANFAGSIATPLIAGAGAIKAATMGVDAAKKFDPNNSVIVDGVKTVFGKQADNIQFGLLQNSFRNTTPKPAKEVKAIDGFASIPLDDNDAINAQIVNTRKVVEVNKKAILSNLKSSDPATIEKGLIEAEKLGHSVADLKGSARSLVSKARTSRESLMSDNSQLNKRSGKFAAFSKTQKSAEELIGSDALKTDAIKQQIEKISQDKSLLEKLSPAIKKGAVGAGVFGSIIAALSTGAQAATVGGGAVASGGMMAALLPLIGPALGIAGVGLGVGAIANYRNSKKTAVPPTTQPVIPMIEDPWLDSGNFPTPIPPRQVGSRKYPKIADPWAMGQAPDLPIPLMAYGQNDQAQVEAAVQRRGAKLPGIIGAAMTGFVALQILPTVGQMLLSGAGESIKKAMQAENLKLTLKAVSASTIDGQKTSSSASATAKMLGTSQLEAVANAAQFKAAINNTGLEGQGDSIISGLAKFGRVNGVTGERLKLAQTALSQMAGKENIMSEEVFGQLAESLPGGAVELAAANGMTVKQLRVLMKSGGAQASKMLPAFGQRMSAIGDLNMQSIDSNPATQIGRLSDSIEQLQLKTGEQVLAPLGFGAGIASKAIELLTSNISTLFGMAGAGAATFGLKLIGLEPIISAIGAAVSKIKLEGLGGLKTAMAPLLKDGVVMAGLYLAGNALGSLFDRMSGDNAPSSQFRKDMEAAANSIEKVNNELRGIKPTIDPVTQNERTEKEFAGKLNAFDQLLNVDSKKILFTEKGISLVDRESNPLGRGTKMRQDGDVEQVDRAIVNIKRITKSISNLKPEDINSADVQKLRAAANKARIDLNLDKGMEPEITKKLTTKKLEADAALNDIEGKYQKGLVDVQAGIKQTKALLDDPYRTSDPAYASAVKEARIELPKLMRYEAELTKQRGLESIEAIKTADAITTMTSRLSSAQAQINRQKAIASNELTLKYSGSLNVGAKIAEQYQIDQTAGSKMIEVLSATLKAAMNEALKTPEVKREVKSLQKAGRLPANLEDTSDAQIAVIEKDKLASTNSIDAIKKFKETRQLLQDEQAKQATLVSDRQKAIKEEIKASNEYYIQSIAAIHQTELASAEAVRDIQTKSYGAQFKGSLQGINSAVGSYMSSLVDQFVELGQLTKIETDRQKVDYDLRMGQLKARQELDSRRNTNTVDGTAAPVDPVSGSAPSVDTGNKSRVMVRRLGAVDDRGLQKLSVAVYGADGNLISDQIANSGSPRNQGFGGAGTTRQGSMAPMEFGKYKIGSDMGGIDQSAVGKIFVPLNPTFGTNRAAIGAHVDANRKYKPGSAGCLVFASQAEFDAFRKAVGTAGAKELIFQPDLGFEPIPAKGLAAAVDSPKMPSGSTLTPDVMARANKYNAMHPSVDNSAQATTPLKKLLLDTIASVEVNDPKSRKGYFERQGGAPFSEAEARAGFPRSVGKNENIGRYQVNRGDFLEAQRRDPSIKDFMPENQDKIALMRMKNSGLPGRDKGAAAAAAFEVNPTFENFQRWRTDAGAEWEGLRDGKTKYRGKDRGINFLKRKGLSDEILYQRAMAQMHQSTALPPTTPQSDPLPTPLSSPGQNNQAVYDETLRNSRLQQLQNEKNAKVLTDNVTLKEAFDSLTAAREYRKNLYREEDGRIKKDRENEIARAANQPSNPLREKQTKARELLYKRQDGIRQANQDRFEIEDEIFGLKAQEAFIKGADRNQMKTDNPAQYKKLLEMEKHVPEAMKNAKKRLKFIDKWIADATKIADDASKYLNETFEIESKNRNTQYSIDSRNRENTALTSQLAEIKVFQERNPFNMGKGDPLRIQAQIDENIAKNTLSSESMELDKQARNIAPEDERGQKGIKEAKDSITAKYLASSQNIKSALQLALDKRDGDVLGFVTEKKLELSGKAQEITNLSLAGVTERERLAPTYSDKPIVDKYASQLAVEQDKLTAETLKIDRERLTKGKAHSDERQRLENLRHQQAISNIGAEYKNALIEAASNREKKKLAIDSARIESELGASAAQSQYLAAQGKTAAARKMEYDDGFKRRALDYRKEMAGLDDAVRLDPSKSADIEQQRKDLEARYLLGQATTATTFQREREQRVRGLGETLEGSRIEALRGKSGLLKSQGNFFESGRLEKQAAYASEALSISQKMKEFDTQLKAELPGSEEYKAISGLREEYQKLSEIKLDSLKQQFTDFGGIITGIQTETGKMIDAFAVGKGFDLLDPIRAGLQELINPIANLAKSGLNTFITKNIKGVVGDLGGLLPQSLDSKDSLNNNAIGSFNPSNPLPVQIVDSEPTIPPMPEIDLFGGADPFGIGAESAAQTIEQGAFNAAKTLAAGGDVTGNLISQGVGVLGDLLGGKSESGGSNWMGGLIKGLGGLFFGGFAEGGTIDSNGVLNAHLPPSPVDNRFIKMASGGFAMLRDGESILTPETTKGIGGSSGVKELNARFKFANGGTVGLSSASIPLATSYSLPAATSSPSPIKIEYTKIGERDYVDREHLNNILAQQEYRQQQTFVEYDRHNQDRATHSVSWRNSMGMG